MPNFPNSSNVEAGDNETQEETNENNQVPLYMNPVTGLARLPWLPGRISLSVHRRNFSPVDRDEIQETKPKWWNITCIVRGCRSFVYSCNLSNKAYSHTPKVEQYIQDKYYAILVEKFSYRLPGSHGPMCYRARRGLSK